MEVRLRKVKAPIIYKYKYFIHLTPNALARCNKASESKKASNSRKLEYFENSSK